MDETDRLFSGGRAAQSRFGWSIRSSAGEAPDPDRLNDAARALGRPVFFVDPDGYECEIIGAALADSGDVAYVETRAKDAGPHPHGAFGRHFDITIRVHLVERSGRQESAEIVSYNPFFGCDVRFFEWAGRSAVLIYREKHNTYACRFGDLWPPRFVQIEDRWIIPGDVLAFVGYKQDMVRRLSFPQLDELGPIPVAEARRVGLLPGDESR